MSFILEFYKEQLENNLTLNAFTEYKNTFFFLTYQFNILIRILFITIMKSCGNFTPVLL